MAVFIPISGIVGIEVLASDIRKQINAANGDDIILQVNSAGGFVFEGFEIFNLIKNAKNKITVELTGLCASIATYLILAADEIIAEENAVFMIHNAYAFSIGDHNELRKTADRLEQSSSLLSEAYSKKTGKQVSELIEMMNQETFIYGKNIVEQGFADSIYEDESQEAKGKDLAFASAKQSIEYCASTMKANKLASEDLEKAAAYLKDFNQQKVAKTDKVDNKSKPLKNKQTNQTGDKMTLAEFLAQNPEAKAQYDADLKAQHEAGQAKQKATFETVAPYLASDSAYGKSVCDLALKALKGEVSSEAVLTTVTTIDAMKEQAKSKDAADDSDGNPDTPPDQGGDQASADGIVRNAVDEAAAIDKLKQS